MSSIIDDNIAYKMFNHALLNIKGRYYSHEKYIMKNPTYACEYAKHLIRGRRVEAEPFIARNPKQSYIYARDILKGRFIECEPFIGENLYFAWKYIREIAKERAPLIEDHIATMLIGTAMNL